MKMDKKVLGVLAAFFIIAILVTFVYAVDAPTSATVTVNEFLSVSLTNTPVNFPSMDPGTTKNASVGNGFPLTATIGNETNVNTNVTTKANQTNFVSGSNTFAVSNMEWSTTSTFPGTDYSNISATVCSGKTAGQTCNIYHQLKVPASQSAGTYNTGITVTALKA